MKKKPKQLFDVRSLAGDRYHFVFALAELLMHQKEDGGQYQADHSDHDVGDTQKRILAAQPTGIADDYALSATERGNWVVCNGWMLKEKLIKTNFHYNQHL